jgi:hypothetical protein
MGDVSRPRVAVIEEPTGTPEGVGYARRPPWLLGPGDVVEVEVERIGTVRTPVVANGYRHGGADRAAAIAV